MSALAEQQPRTHEQQKSFEPCASVYRIRDDYDLVGYLLPETREQIRNEDFSYLAEGVDLPSRTTFTLQRQGNELVYFNRGEWQPYMAMLVEGMNAAANDTQRDPRRRFQEDIVFRDYQYGLKMQALKPGEQLQWDSPYRKDIQMLFGEKFMRDIGMQPERKMGFLYRAFCNEDGSVTLETQSVDNSDPDAFLAVREAASYDPAMTMDAAMRYYDGALFKKSGVRHFAGRTRDDKIKNVWSAINEQQDLIDFHLSYLETLARSDYHGMGLESAVTQHVLGLWALLKKRFDGAEPPAAGGDHLRSESPQVEYRHLMRQIQDSYKEVVRGGKMMSGCGGSLKATADPFEVDFDETRKSIFGEDESKPEKYSFDTKMFCARCQAPPKEKETKKMCGPCGFCRDCDKALGGKG